MENSDKKIDLKVTMGLRNEFLCKKCDTFPRPDVKLMRCSSCTGLLCQNCCEKDDDDEDDDDEDDDGDIKTKCPLCHHKSKDPKISTFTEESQLMKVLSGFKTHPCINLKNGCHEEIPAKLDTLKAHDESCILQMVPCPSGLCVETFIFKDLEQHLKKVHTNQFISIFYGTENNEYTRFHYPGIFGIYIKKAELVNERNYYEMGKYGIWFTPNGYWMIGYSSKKGQDYGFAKVEKDISFPDTTTNWEWEWLHSYTKANKGLGSKGIYL